MPKSVKNDPPYDPKKMFNTAQSYYEASLIVNKQVFDKPSLGLSIIVLQCLSLEIFLKCVYNLENTQNADGHHFVDLYNSLSDNTQNGINTFYDFFSSISPIRSIIQKQCPSTDLSLLGCLEASNKAFENLRYGYEGKHSSFIIQNAIQAVRQYIFSKYATQLDIKPMD
jgi:hypothetical protein